MAVLCLIESESRIEQYFDSNLLIRGSLKELTHINSLSANEPETIPLCRSILRCKAKNNDAFAVARLKNTEPAKPSTDARLIEFSSENAIEWERVIAVKIARSNSVSFLVCYRHSFLPFLVEMSKLSEKVS